MRILHIVETARGGCGTYLNELVPVQMRDPLIESIHVIAPDRHLSILEDVPRSLIGPFRRPNRVVGLIWLSVAASASIRGFRPDIIHAHSTFAGLILRLAAIFLPGMPPVVYCPHGWAFTKEQSAVSRRFVGAVERFLCRGSKRIIAISDAERKDAESMGIDKRQLVVIYNGINSRLDNVVPALWKDDRRKVLFVGRLDRQKGVDILMQAAEGLEDRISLRIVGAAVVSDTTPLPRTSAHVAYLGWQDRVGVAEQIAAADIVVMPSRWEGFGLVAIEAMRAGKAVIASSVGGLPEVVLHLKTGRLVPPNDPAALRVALLADTQDDILRMGQAGRERFQLLFTIENTHAALMKVYRDVCNRRLNTKIAAQALEDKQTVMRAPNVEPHLRSFRNQSAMNPGA